MKSTSALFYSKTVGHTYHKDWMCVHSGIRMRFCFYIESILGKRIKYGHSLLIENVSIIMDYMNQIDMCICHGIYTHRIPSRQQRTQKNRPIIGPYRWHSNNQITGKRTSRPEKRCNILKTEISFVAQLKGSDFKQNVRWSVDTQTNPNTTWFFVYIIYSRSGSMEQLSFSR